MSSSPSGPGCPGFKRLGSLLCPAVLLTCFATVKGQAGAPDAIFAEAQQTFKPLLATSLAPAAHSILANPPLAEDIALSPLVDYLHSNQAAVGALISSAAVNEVLNNPAVVAGLAQDPSLPALLDALPPAQAAALDDIINARVTGNTAADLNNIQASIGPEVGVPVPAVTSAATPTNARKLLTSI